MPHVLMTGMTESGKTTLAKLIAEKRKQSGRGILVFDPLCTHWACDYQSNDQQEFLEVVWSSESCDVFVDEAGKAAGHYNDLMIELATMGRHWGHNCFFICQRAHMVSPSIRTQCRVLFAFNQNGADPKTLAGDWGYDELLNCNKLKQGEYFHAQRFKTISRGRVF